MKKTLLILTGGEHQVPIVRAARALGIRTVVTDRSINAPAFAECDEQVVADAKDAETILEAAKRFRVDGVLAEQTDVAVNTGAAVGAALALPTVSVDAAARATNKFLMREACRRANIPGPRYRLVHSLDACRASALEIGFPVVVKPVDSQASRGVTKVASVNEVDEAFARALGISANGILVEEQMMGIEGSIESIVQDEKIFVLGLCDKVKSPPPFSYDLRLTYPGSFDPAIAKQITELNERVIRAIGIRTGFTHAEFIVTAEGVRLIEIAARGCGAQVVTKLLPAMLDLDLVSLRIRQAMGERIDPTIEPKFHGVLEFIVLPPGRIATIDSTTAARSPGVVGIHLHRRIGDVVSSPENADGRFGFVLAVGDDRASAVQHAEQAVQALGVHVSPVF